MIIIPQTWGLILNYSTTITVSINYLTLLNISLPIPSLEKSGIVRPDNRFGKSNPGISATMKCFWIPTLVAKVRMLPIHPQFFFLLLKLSCLLVGSWHYLCTCEYIWTVTMYEVWSEWNAQGKISLKREGWQRYITKKAILCQTDSENKWLRSAV